MSFHPYALAAALLAAAPLGAQTAAPAAPAQDTQALFKLGQQLTEWLLMSEADSILAHMSPETAANAGGPEGIRGVIAQIQSRAGNEVGVLDQKMNRRRGLPQFWYEANFENLSEPLVIRWLFDSTAKIAGVGVGPKSGTPPPDEGS